MKCKEKKRTYQSGNKVIGKQKKKNEKLSKEMLKPTQP